MLPYRVSNPRPLTYESGTPNEPSPLSLGDYLPHGHKRIKSLTFHIIGLESDLSEAYSN